MIGGGVESRIVFVGLIVPFVCTPSANLVTNVLADVFLYSREPDVVDEDVEPASLPTIHVFLPRHEEPREVVHRTHEYVVALDYPTDSLAVYLVTERDDAIVDGYVDELVETVGAAGLSVERTTVDGRTVRPYVRDGT